MIITALIFFYNTRILLQFTFFLPLFFAVVFIRGAKFYLISVFIFEFLNDFVLSFGQLVFLLDFCLDFLAHIPHINLQSLIICTDLGLFLALRRFTQHKLLIHAIYGYWNIFVHQILTFLLAKLLLAPIQTMKEQFPLTDLLETLDRS